MLDSGTTLLLLSTEAYLNYKRMVGAEEDPKTGLLCLPEGGYQRLKNLDFTIAGLPGKLTLTPNAQIWPRKLNGVVGGSSECTYLVVGNVSLIRLLFRCRGCGDQRAVLTCDDHVGPSQAGCRVQRHTGACVPRAVLHLLRWPEPQDRICDHQVDVRGGELIGRALFLYSVPSSVLPHNIFTLLHGAFGHCKLVFDNNSSKNASQGMYVQSCSKSITMEASLFRTLTPCI
jgi:hypothetical protein